MTAQQNDRSPDTRALYAWLSRDADGLEGIIAAAGAAGVTPLVVADEARARRLAPIARDAAAARGFPARLVRFTRGEELDEVGP